MLTKYGIVFGNVVRVYIRGKIKMRELDSLLVNDVQKQAFHDGSGIRTVIFLKGCPLRCKWCCNPESQKETPEIIYRRQKCIGREECGLCRKGEEGKCIYFDRDGRARVDFTRIPDDLQWTNICPTGAISIEGKRMKIDELLDIVEQDTVLHKSGKGGVTLSGGEPLMQENLVLFLKRARARRINTAIETCGYANRKKLLEAAGYLDRIFYDIKSLDDTKHKIFTGVSNKVIIENLQALCEAFPKKHITVRTPIVPGFNENKSDLKDIKKFVASLPNVKWERVPYHTNGLIKYEMLGREYPMKSL